ncbi:MAG: DegV family protein [Gammaproteobacteria bacterium]
MPMKIGVVIDASCDLPRSFIEDHQLVVMPGLLEFGDKEIVDLRDPKETLSVYRRFIADKSILSRSRAPEVEQIRDLFLDDLVLRYDRVLVLCVSGTRGRVFDRATQASYAILQGYRERREQAGRGGQFALRVLDTGNVGPGEGVLAHEAIRIIEEQAPPFEKLRRTLKDMARQTICLTVPHDLWYLHNRARSKGENSMTLSFYRLGRALEIKPILEMRDGRSRVAGSVRGFERAVARVLDQARDVLSKGHILPVVVMSFGGDPRIIREMTAYQEFEAFAAAHKCRLHLSVMSASMAVNVGPGAFALAYIQK